MTGKERLQEVVSRLRAHADEYRSCGVIHLAVFGSVARGEADEASDVDLVLDLDYEKRPTLFVLMDVQERSEKILGTKVDIVPRGGVASRPGLADAISRDAVAVF